MIEVNVKQGSPEWLAARVGIPTASNFDRIITPKTLKPSGQAKRYIADLCAEWLIGAIDQVETPWMQRGSDLEKSAVAYYELQTGQDTREVGFCMTVYRSIGCSPDRLIGDDGGLEIKCPSPAVHVMHLLGSPAEEYRAQVQGCLMVTGRAWWDLLSFHPDLPPALVRVERDEGFIAAMGLEVAKFLMALDYAKDQLLKMGCVPKEPESHAEDRSVIMLAGLQA